MVVSMATHGLQVVLEPQGEGGAFGSRFWAAIRQKGSAEVDLVLKLQL
jgi:hypothetical protein